MTIKLIVGLRNPGIQYEKTRHNAGGWFAEALATHFQASFRVDQKLKAELSQIENDQLTCRILKPLTYMNESGLSVRAVSRLYKIKPEEILVAHDELDLEAGRIKLKTGGGNAGHNGLRDIIAQLGCSNFHRLRIGIGHPGHKNLVLNYVLGKPSQEDKQSINEAIQKIINSISIIVAGDFANAMNLLH